MNKITDTTSLEKTLEIQGKQLYTRISYLQTLPYFGRASIPKCILIHDTVAHPLVKQLRPLHDLRRQKRPGHQLQFFRLYVRTS